MKGTPKFINSRDDYIYIKENCPPEFWKPIWKGLLDTHYYWEATDILKKEEQCIVDNTHRYEILLPVEGSNDPVRYQQYELKENLDCDLVRFGFTEEEIKAALSM